MSAQIFWHPRPTQRRVDLRPHLREAIQTCVDEFDESSDASASFTFEEHLVVIVRVSIKPMIHWSGVGHLFRAQLENGSEEPFIIAEFILEIPDT